MGIEDGKKEKVPVAGESKKPHWKNRDLPPGSGGERRQLSQLFDSGRVVREAIYKKKTDERGTAWEKVHLSEKKILEEWQNNGRSYRRVQFQESLPSENGTRGERDIKIFEATEELGGSGEWEIISGKEKVNPRYNSFD